MLRSKNSSWFCQKIKNIFSNFLTQLEFWEWRNLDQKTSNWSKKMPNFVRYFGYTPTPFFNCSNFQILGIQEYYSQSESLYLSEYLNEVRYLVERYGILNVILNSWGKNLLCADYFLVHVKAEVLMCPQNFNNLWILTKYNFLKSTFLIKF